MSVLPDELWSRILELGTATSQLGCRELCSLSISCRRLNRLSGDSALWAVLLAFDFPHAARNPDPPSKSLYKTLFERDKARRMLAWRRAVLNAESKVAVSRKRLEDLEMTLSQENERLKVASVELANLEKVRRASVALRVWQPEVVRGSQKQIVEQCTVPIESRISSLKMEVKVCKQQIAVYNKAYNDEKKKLGEYREAVNSLKYLPLQNNQLGATIGNCNKKQKKLKQSCDFPSFC